jgi:hypothetical protein
MPEYALLHRILLLSDPLKLEVACRLPCDHHLQREICRLFRDDLDTAVGLLSDQIGLIREETVALLN